MPKKLSKDETSYRQIKAYLMHPEYLESMAGQLYKVLDMQGQGLFDRKDLNNFIDIMLSECELQGVGRLAQDKID